MQSITLFVRLAGLLALVMMLGSLLGGCAPGPVLTIDVAKHGERPPLVAMTTDVPVRPAVTGFSAMMSALGETGPPFPMHFELMIDDKDVKRINLSSPLTELEYVFATPNRMQHFAVRGRCVYLDKYRDQEWQDSRTIETELQTGQLLVVIVDLAPGHETFQTLYYLLEDENYERATQQGNAMTHHWEYSRWLTDFAKSAGTQL